MDAQNLKIIGNQEWCSFDQLKIPAIRARIDSGAKTSSIQATDIEIFHKNEDPWVRFTVFPIQRSTKHKVICKAKILDKRSIKSSFGKAEDRLIIKTPITIGDETFEIELSLANRNTMKFRMLLGREAISGRFLINPAVKHVQKAYTRKAIAALYKFQTGQKSTRQRK